MKKVAMLLVVLGLLLAFGLPSAFAAVTDEQQRQLDGLNQQMVDLQKQMVQKQLEAGLITKEQAAYMIQDIDLRSQYLANQNQYPNQAPNQYGNGWGRGAWWNCGWGGYYGNQRGWGCW